jgi:hypothetical protein
METSYIIICSIAAVFLLVHLHDEIKESNYRNEEED